MLGVDENALWDAGGNVFRYVRKNVQNDVGDFLKNSWKCVERREKNVQSYTEEKVLLDSEHVPQKSLCERHGS